MNWKVAPKNNATAIDLGDNNALVVEGEFVWYENQSGERFAIEVPLVEEYATGARPQTATVWELAEMLGAA